MQSLLYILGLKHSGKSTLGKLLASDLGYHWADSDELLVQWYKLQQERDQHSYPVSLASGGFLPRAFLNYHGNEIFQSFEYQSLVYFLESKKFPRIVLSLGGGFMENPWADRVFQAYPGECLFLDVPEDILFDRIITTGIPPFLAAPSLSATRSKWQNLYQKRRSLGLDLASRVVSLEKLSVQQAYTKIFKELNIEPKRSK